MGEKLAAGGGEASGWGVGPGEVRGHASWFPTEEGSLPAAANVIRPGGVLDFVAAKQLFGSRR